MSLLGPRPPHLHLATVGAKVWLAVSSLLSQGRGGAARRPHGYKAQGVQGAGLTGGDQVVQDTARSMGPLIGMHTFAYI